MAYYNVERFGPARDNAHAAIIARAIFAAIGVESSLDDFMLKFESVSEDGKPDQVVQTPEQMQCILASFTKAFNSGQC
jgi:hypothetical protein